MKLQQILQEAVFDTDRLVDRIYDIAFAGFIDRLADYVHGKDIGRMPHIATSRSTALKLDGRDLYRFMTDQQRQAYDMNPVTFYVGCFADGSWYKPNDNAIQISFNDGVYKMIEDAILRKLPFTEVMHVVPSNKIRNFMDEVNGEVVKATAAHEISHWMDDTFHNSHIKKMIDAAGEDIGGSRRIMLRGKGAIANTPYEIDAQIHSIRQLKRRYTQEQWDMMSLDYLFSMYPSWNANIIPKLKSAGLYDDWRKTVLRRLNREGLLGKNMR